ncbi:MAG: histidine kinase dimerization/phospho-acceptor domain-containing protein, partial [Acetobacteraceae bacterium]
MSEGSVAGPPAFLAGGGEMGALVRAFEWAATDLGPAEGWPQSLKTAVSICLGSRHPIVLWWGRSALTQFYNSAYIPCLGPGKHPWALGRSGRESWSEIWSIIGPMIERVFETGEATWSEDLLLVLDRTLPREEAYFTFSYSPIRNEDGAIGGIFCAVQEATLRVIGERRLKTLSDLRPMSVEAEAEGACAAAARALEDNPADIPFSLIYLLDEHSTRARLAAATGLRPGDAGAPYDIDLQDRTGAGTVWPLGQALDSGAVLLVADVQNKVGRLRGGRWPENIEEAMIVPIPGASGPSGLLVSGISPRLLLTSEYRDFLDLIAAHIGSAITNARVHEEERRRAEALAEIDRAKTTFFSNVSHEFRTPLTLMLGPLEEALAGADLTPARREPLEVAHRNALRVLKLVNSLLDFSRVESGRMEARYQPTDLAAFTAELASTFRSLCERAGLRR